MTSWHTLGIKIKRNSGGYELSQTHYVEKVLIKFNHLYFKKVTIPFDPRVKLQNNDERVLAQLKYASACNVLDPT